MYKFRYIYKFIYIYTHIYKTHNGAVKISQQPNNKKIDF